MFASNNAIVDEAGPYYGPGPDQDFRKRVAVNVKSAIINRDVVAHSQGCACNSFGCSMNSFPIALVVTTSYCNGKRTLTSNDGWYPASPWLTLRKALTAAGSPLEATVTHGSSINIINSGALTDTNFINCNFDNYDNSPAAGPGPNGAPVQIRGLGRDVSSFTVNGNANTFFFDREKHAMQIFDMSVNNTTVSNNEIFNLSKPEINILLSDSKIGSSTQSVRAFRANAGGDDSSVVAKRTLIRGTDARMALQCSSGATGFSFAAESCIFDGFERASYIYVDTTMDLKHCSILNYQSGQSGLDQDASLTIAPKYRNIAVYQAGSGASIDAANGAAPVADVDTNFNIVSTATNAAGLQGSNGSVEDPLLDLTTYAPLSNSPCIGAGQNVGVTYDYNGNLFRSSNPSVGAIEANPMPFPAPTSGGSSNDGIVSSIVR